MVLRSMEEASEEARLIVKFMIAEEIEIDLRERGGNAELGEGLSRFYSDLSSRVFEVFY